MAAAPASQASIIASPTASPAAYEAWLKAQIDAGDANAIPTLNGFSKLSADKQTKFLNYIKDPSTTQKFVAFLNGTTDSTSVDPNYDAVSGTIGLDNPPSPFVGNDGIGTGVVSGAAPTELASAVDQGGDETRTASTMLTTPSGISVPVSQVRGQAADWKASYWVNDKLFGIKISEVKIWVNYHSNTSRVTKVYSAGASHYDYVPRSSFSHSVVSKWISAAGNAHAETVWTAKVDLPLAGSSEWSSTEHIWADETGFRGGSLKN
ncbi:hypothetical protein ACIRUL_15950 [Streptomyces sp. NPDC101171]|uniref:hypothetical protein n=1 Tax=Streptomyces sp. NPDC101171 TaxID=3366122 RepID=UPI00382DEC05